MVVNLQDSEGQIFLNNLTVLCYFKEKNPVIDIYRTIPYTLKIDDAVVDEYREAVRLNPDDSELRTLLGRVLMHKGGNLSEGLAEYRKAIRLKPQGANLHFELGVHLLLNGQLDGAISEIRDTLRIDPAGQLGQGNLHAILGNLLQRKGDLHSAFAEFRHAYLYAGDDCCGSVGLKFLAGCLHLTGKAEDEIEVFRTRIRSHPGEIYTITRLAEIFRSQGKPNEEIAVYREAIRLNSTFPEVHGLLAKMLRRQGMLEEAGAESTKQISLYNELIRVQFVWLLAFSCCPG
jgi:tetratricopeptide (TPR) repeat protein